MRYILCLFALAVLLLVQDHNSSAKPKLTLPTDPTLYTPIVLKKKCDSLNTKATKLDKKTKEMYLILRQLLDSKKKKKINE